MRRLATVIFSILLGAIAVGIGMGVFLNKANQDRQRLEQVAMDAQGKSKEAQEQSQKAIQEANDKLKSASDEIAKAQAALKAVEDERALLAKADTLPTPDPKTSKDWAEAVSLDQGVTLKYPRSNKVENNDAKALTLATEPKSSDLASYDARWLSITPYDIRLENELLATVASTTPVSFAVKGRLLYGVQGISLDSSYRVFVMRLQSMGQLTHMIWGREPNDKKSQPVVLQALSTLTFQR